jgi:urease accessory protein
VTTADRRAAPATSPLPLGEGQGEGVKTGGAPPGAVGFLGAVFSARSGRTDLTHLRCQPPLQSLRALRRGAAAELVVATLGPGLMGGDRVHLSVRAEAGADARVGSTAANRVLPARGGLGVQAEIRLDLAAGARLAYLPQATILQAGAAYRQRVAVALAPGALALVGELLVPGRLARGEAFAFAELDASLEARGPDGDLLVAERQRVVPADLDPRSLGSLTGCGLVLASLFVLAPGCDLTALGDAIAAGLPPAAGLTALPNAAGLLVRGLLPSAQAAELLLLAAVDLAYDMAAPGQG